jgi:hypothetical protein
MCREMLLKWPALSTTISSGYTEPNQIQGQGNSGFPDNPGNGVAQEGDLVGGTAALDERVRGPSVRSADGELAFVLSYDGTISG